MNRDWNEAFGTRDREEIEAMVTSRGMICRWHPNGRILHTENVVNPLPRHPDTGEQCLNLQAFHRTSIFEISTKSDRAKSVPQRVSKNGAQDPLRARRYAGANSLRRRNAYPPR